MKKIILTLIVIATVILTPIDNNNGRSIIKYAFELDNNVEVDLSRKVEPQELNIEYPLVLEIPKEVKNSEVKTSEKIIKVVETKTTYYKVKSFALNKRKTANVAQSPIGYLGQNEPVKGILTLDNGWVELSDASYVNGRYLAKIDIANDDEFNNKVEQYKKEREAKLAEQRKQERLRQERRAEQQKTAKQSSNESETKSVGRNGISLTRSDRDLLARLVRAEAGGESYEGMVAVASVVLNRVVSGQFPNSIRGVIYAKNQFDPVSNGSINKPASDIHFRAVDDALNRDNTNGALFFYAPAVVKSSYMESLHTVAVIGGHHFKVN